MKKKGELKLEIIGNYRLEWSVLVRIVECWATNEGSFIGLVTKVEFNIIFNNISFS